MKKSFRFYIILLLLLLLILIIFPRKTRLTSPDEAKPTQRELEKTDTKKEAPPSPRVQTESLRPLDYQLSPEEIKALEKGDPEMTPNEEAEYLKKIETNSTPAIMEPGVDRKEIEKTTEKELTDSELVELNKVLPPAIVDPNLNFHEIEKSTLDEKD